jgi:hypothetical protein
LLTALRSLDAGNPQIGYIVRAPTGVEEFQIAQGTYGILVNEEKLLREYLMLCR